MAVTVNPDGSYSFSDSYGNDSGIHTKLPYEGSGNNASDLANQKPEWNQDNFMDNLVSLANKGDEAAIEKLINIWSTQESEKTARDWTASREDSAYQRLNEDLKKAGISPYILSGATPMVSSSSGKSYSGSEMTSRSNNKNTQYNQDARTAVTAIIGIITALLFAAL